MKRSFLGIRRKQWQLSFILSVFGLLFFFSCKSKEPPLSPAAKSFKREVNSAITTLSDALVEPVSASDIRAINAALTKLMPESIKLCRACPFMIGVLDKDGVALTIYPVRRDQPKYYSHYNIVLQALRKQNICQGSFYLQDGTKLYTICAPLVKKRQTVGILVLTTTYEEIKQRWDIPEQELFKINFNK
jgi:hypothetical protein